MRRAELLGGTAPMPRWEYMDMAVHCRASSRRLLTSVGAAGGWLARKVGPGREGADWRWRLVAVEDGAARLGKALLIAGNDDGENSGGDPAG